MLLKYHSDVAVNDFIKMIVSINLQQGMPKQAGAVLGKGLLLLCCSYLLLYSPDIVCREPGVCV